MREAGLAQSPRRVPDRVAESTRQHLDHLDERDGETLISPFLHLSHRLLPDQDNQVPSVLTGPVGSPH